MFLNIVLVLLFSLTMVRTIELIMYINKKKELEQIYQSYKTKSSIFMTKYIGMGSVILGTSIIIKTWIEGNINTIGILGILVGLGYIYEDILKVHITKEGILVPQKPYYIKWSNIKGYRIEDEEVFYIQFSDKKEVNLFIRKKNIFEFERDFNKNLIVQ